MYEVADRAGVSIASVSRVLAGHDRVRSDTRDRVTRAVAEVGYVPVFTGDGIAAGRTHTESAPVGADSVSPY